MKSPTRISPSSEVEIPHCCQCRIVVAKKRDSFQVKHQGSTMWFDRAVCLSLWIDDLRRMRARAQGLEFRS